MSYFYLFFLDELSVLTGVSFNSFWTSGTGVFSVPIQGLVSLTFSVLTGAGVSVGVGGGGGGGGIKARE